MKALTSRPELGRDDLNPHQTEMVASEIEKIARELKLWLSAEDKDALKFTPRQNLVCWHSSLGRAIRNEYELWIEGHHITEIWREAEKKFPLPKDGPLTIQMDIGDGRAIKLYSDTPLISDWHPCHPDNFSAKVIERLWEILQ